MPRLSDKHHCAENMSLILHINHWVLGFTHKMRSALGGIWPRKPLRSLSTWVTLMSDQLGPSLPFSVAIVAARG